MAVALGGVDQPLDLGLCQMLTAAQIGVRPPARRNCSVYGGWRDQLEAGFGQGFRSVGKPDCS
jgi:hypothetical protein